MDVLNNMFVRNIIDEKNAYRVTDLLIDINVSLDYGLNDPPITSSKYLKEHIRDRFGDLVEFTKVGKHNVVHPNDLSPLDIVA